MLTVDALSVLTLLATPSILSLRVLAEAAAALIASDLAVFALLCASAAAAVVADE